MSGSEARPPGHGSGVDPAGGLTTEAQRRIRDLIALYPRTRSALIPALHVAQEQHGWLTPGVMTEVAALLGLEPAEVYGTASFYDMLFTHPVGRYLVSVCTNLACMLNGGEELLEHASQQLGVAPGGTTADGNFTLEEVECIAFCGAAPCLAVNWRFFGNLSHDDFDRLTEDLAAGRLADEVPTHGTLSRVRREVGLPGVDAIVTATAAANGSANATVGAGAGADPPGSSGPGARP
ncbi:MAG: NADH-quinone oxidoreductase subunit NuoE family protein [Acidimicrobiales bacterium]